MNIKEEIKRELVGLGVIAPNLRFTLKSGNSVDGQVIGVQMGGIINGVFVWSDNTAGITRELFDSFGKATSEERKELVDHLCRRLTAGWV